MQGCSNCEAFIKDSFNTFYNLESILVYMFYLFTMNIVPKVGNYSPFYAFILCSLPNILPPLSSFPPFLVLFELPSALFRNFSFVPINPSLF